MIHRYDGTPWNELRTPRISGLNVLVVNVLVVNVLVVNGLDATNGSLADPYSLTTTTTNGLGNLIIGYHENSSIVQNVRTGSHSLVLGAGSNFLGFGGAVMGRRNRVDSPCSVVLAGESNTASGAFSAISGGAGNTTGADYAAISGGLNRTTHRVLAWVAGTLLEDHWFRGLPPARLLLRAEAVATSCCP